MKITGRPVPETCTVNDAGSHAGTGARGAAGAGAGADAVGAGGGAGEPAHDVTNQTARVNARFIRADSI